MGLRAGLRGASEMPQFLPGSLPSAPPGPSLRSLWALQNTLGGWWGEWQTGPSKGPGRPEGLETWVTSQTPRSGDVCDCSQV